ncbi:hypothetical protein [Rhizobium tumorigenes]|uniref:hypothetical protein n=1 Tax=Rhizobium tumorigenes TaxID=2041385 RepID=UPI003BFA1157
MRYLVALIGDVIPIGPIALAELCDRLAKRGNAGMCGIGLGKAYGKVEPDQQRAGLLGATCQPPKQGGGIADKLRSCD